MRPHPEGSSEGCIVFRVDSRLAGMVPLNEGLAQSRPGQSSWGRRGELSKGPQFSTFEGSLYTFVFNAQCSNYVN